jgi:thiosulfate dehydrogenase
MTLKTVSAGFLVVYLVIGAATLAAYRPAPVAPPASPVSGDGWPDYSAGGPGFTAPASSNSELISYGYRLVAQTFAEIGPNASHADKRFAGNNLACQSCHLDGGTNRHGLPLVGVLRTYPKFSERDQRVISLAERVNECMERSMNGRALPQDSREMAAFLAFLDYVGTPAAMKSQPPTPSPQPADATRGAGVYGRVCAACHQPTGLGVRDGSASEAKGYQFPPLWGPDSFNDGAGMDRFDRAVGFIQHNMPRGTDPTHPQLNLQEAWDVVAFLREKPRPHFQATR